MTKTWLKLGIAFIAVAVVLSFAATELAEWLVERHESGNIADVSVSGTLHDGQGRPLADAEVLVRCKILRDLDKEDQIDQSGGVTADGGFSYRFERCAEVYVAAKAPRFLPARKIGLIGQNLSIDFALEPVPKEVTAIARKWYLIGAPYVSLRSRPEGIEPWGYDIINDAQSNDPEAMDLWLDPAEQPSHDNFPSTFVTGSRGGTLPIFWDDLRHTSPWFKPDAAPTTGYSQTYTLQGGEAGLFVRCRDGVTYAKVLWGGGLSVGNRCPGEQDRETCREWGYGLGVLYQPDGTTNLSYTEDVDLDFFIDGHVAPREVP